jgi:hypothetical protein
MQRRGYRSRLNKAFTMFVGVYRNLMGLTVVVEQIKHIAGLGRICIVGRARRRRRRHACAPHNSLTTGATASRRSLVRNSPWNTGPLSLKPPQAATPQLAPTPQRHRYLSRSQVLRGRIPATATARAKRARYRHRWYRRVRRLIVQHRTGRPSSCRLGRKARLTLLIVEDQRLAPRQAETPAAPLRRR